MRVLSAWGRACAGLTAALVMLAWGGAAAVGDDAGDPLFPLDSLRVSAVDPAGYLVLPKVIVHSSGATPPNSPPAVGEFAIDTLVQLTNLSDEQITVSCYYVNANGHCGGGGGPVCVTDQDCNDLGLFGLVCVQAWAVEDFQFTLTPFQPIAWAASSGLLAPTDIPCADPPCGPCPGPGCASGVIGKTQEDPFRGELKCVQITTADPAADGPPVARNDLKAEATIIGRRVTVPFVTPEVYTASYNAIGFEADESAQCTSDADCPLTCDLIVNQCTCIDNSDCPRDLECAAGICRFDADGPLCLGLLPTGTNVPPPAPGGDIACAMNYAPCPGVVSLDHFFDGADTGLGVVNTELTLVPCSEDLGSTAGATVTAHMLVYNEFEQRFSTSARVPCYLNMTLADIDTQPGPGDDPFSIFAAGVQGTIAGHTRIRGVQGPEGRAGYGLIGVAQEFYRDPQLGTTVQSSTGYNIHNSGFRPRGDAVYR